MSATPGSTTGISAKNQLEESTAKPTNGTKLDSFRGSLNTREQAIAERAERRTQRSERNQALAETQKEHVSHTIFPQLVFPLLIPFPG